MGHKGTMLCMGVSSDMFRLTKASCIKNNNAAISIFLRVLMIFMDDAILIVAIQKEAIPAVPNHPRRTQEYAQR